MNSYGKSSVFHPKRTFYGLYKYVFIAQLLNLSTFTFGNGLSQDCRISFMVFFACKSLPFTYTTIDSSKPSIGAPLKITSRTIWPFFAF